MFFNFDENVLLNQGCATGGPRATTRPAKPFNVALGKFQNYLKVLDSLAQGYATRGPLKVLVWPSEDF